MLLVIDIGNTNIVFGVAKGASWEKIWRIQTDPNKTADEYEVLFSSLFLGGEIGKTDISQVVLSSVVPSLVRPFREMIQNLLGLDALLIGPEMYHQLPIKILNPYEIGTDLVANATAAFIMHSAPCMVIDFGTALTFTTIGPEGNIMGVAIAPGLRTAINSLASNTAQLPHVQLVAPPSPLGKNTVHAIQSGIILGYTGLVNSMIERTEKEIGARLTVIATGGLVSVIAPLSGRIDKSEINLTLDGLRLIAEIAPNANPNQI